MNDLEPQSGLTAMTV